ncbi:MAG TPA: DEAD/DEAH box helicase [Povalibacter sp.]|uniref:DEAD/DEAH box helicase n=1 Tax=Povalibacter sp. TaxID=1962978 RepID=UPI002D0010D6|nr:DEAD/DEAH box helicase [Povalibacter sp.]HMN46095.1 DEAD/DEAH box helicase [Povalibacter sp.]
MSGERLRVLLGEPLAGAAQQLIDAGHVSKVRVLQDGGVVTGVAGNNARVYVQYSADAPHLQAECSCGAPPLCVHAAAVSLAAAHSIAQPAATTSRTAAAASASNVGTRAQQLFYLCDAAAGTLRVSVSVGRLSGADEQPQDLCAFAHRAGAGSDDLPRYVDADDATILRRLAHQSAAGPWTLDGAAAADVLQQLTRTGRAYWQSFQRRPLRRGDPRPGHFVWRTTARGDQFVACETDPAVGIFASAEPPLYVDAATNEWGSLEPDCAAPLLRRFWNQPPAPPERVTHIVREIAGASFPAPRTLHVRPHAFSELRPQLILTAGPAGTLHLLYDGVAIDHATDDGRGLARLLDPDDPGIVREFERNRSRERELRSRLDRVLPHALQGAREWLGFMLEAMPALEADGWSVQCDESFPYRIARADQWYADLGVPGDDRWFDLRLGIAVEGTPVNLLPALVAYLQANTASGDAYCVVGDFLMVRLEDGRYLPLELERVRRISDTLVELFDRDSLNKRNALSLPFGHASRLAPLVQALQLPSLQSEDETLQQRLRELEAFKGIAPLPAPASFRATLRGYQEEGLGWLQFLRRFAWGGILADDMGLGKTVQALAHLSIEKEQGRLRGPSLIVAPVSVIGNWQHELRTFAPALEVLTLHGARRRELFHRIRSVDVVVVGYPSLQLDGEALLAHEFDFVVLDEAQTIKSPRARVSQMARALRARHRLCLTGTPMENHLGELWSLFDFIQPGLLGSEKAFQRHYRMPIERNGNRQRAAALAERIAPFVLRRTKDAVARDLPEKTQIVESILLDERQRDFYDGIRLAMHARVREAIEQQGLARSHITMLDALLKLRQACCDPRLVGSDADTRQIPSAKMDWLTTVLPELVAEGRRILLFSQFTSMLELIEHAVRELGIPYCLLTGATRNRTEVVERFQRGNVPLFLISLKAGGTGLNLTAADTVIHYDPWWNPAAEAQATDRAHRIGQQQPVFVYRLIAAGTVEEKILQLQDDKRALASQMYSDANASPTQLSAADLEKLLLS